MQLSPFTFPCAVFNWTTDHVLDWLEHYVELPEYVDTFKIHQITGRQLPHLAINSGQILQNTLSITDSQHKQKIQLRAMDVVLFGPPVQRGHWKDTILKISTVLIVCGTIYAFRQKRVSKLRMDSFMEDLRLKEEEVKRLKSKFEALEMESVDGPPSSNKGSQEDIPLMMAPTPTSSGSDDESTTSFCKYVDCPLPRPVAHTDLFSCCHTDLAPTTHNLLSVRHRRAWSCFDRGCGHWRRSLI